MPLKISKKILVFVLSIFLLNQVLVSVNAVFNENEKEITQRPINIIQFKFKANTEDSKKEKLKQKIQNWQNNEYLEEIKNLGKEPQLIKAINQKIKNNFELKIAELNSEELGMFEYIEPNYLALSQGVIPNDTDYNLQWDLQKINVSEVWQSSTGSEATIIAVLDTGLNYEHPDRPQNLIQGYNFINSDNIPADDYGHGTFVSGLIAANTNNFKGVAGTCWNCSIMPLKVLDSNGVGTYEDIAIGIRYAVEHGAQIINLSLGGYEYSQALKEAVDYAILNNVILIAAGGNLGTNETMYPAGYSGVIGVAGTDKNDDWWSRSNYGSHIDISAPSTEIYGLGLKEEYTYMTGTSMATAIVSGAAGLLLSANPKQTTEEIKYNLMQNVIDLGEEG